MYLEESISLINAKLVILNGKKNIAVWGAAENTVRLFQYTDIIRYNIQTIIDNGKYGEAFFGNIILRADNVNWDDIDAVVISSFYREDDIFDELKNKYLFDKTIIRLNDPKMEKPFYQYLMKSELEIPVEYKDIIYKNRKFYNIHQGERLFIIGNGPSIKNTDLKKINNAKKMAVSNFYLHNDYKIVNPDYYCFAQFTYTSIFNEEIGARWLTDVGNNSGFPQFFFNISEKNLIDQCDSFKGKKINYMYLDKINPDYYDEIDITNKIMCGQSVTIDCLQLAIYMGFKEVYLVGVEHSEILSKQYDYFYERRRSVTGDKDMYASDNGNVITKFSTQLRTRYYLWEQYKRVKKIAKAKGVTIYNATKGGLLDVFERVDYNELF